MGGGGGEFREVDFEDVTGDCPPLPSDIIRVFFSLGQMAGALPAWSGVEFREPVIWEAV